ncbi:MAG: glycoside hydrolase family 9 protein [Elainellaceae cyanobacterium]
MAPADVTFSVQNDWGSGFTGQFLLEPLSALEGWTIEFEADFDIAEIWNADIVSRDGDRYVIHSKDWNGALDLGQSVSIGFNGRSTSGDTPTVTQLGVNGAPAAPPPATTPTEIANDEGTNADRDEGPEISEPPKTEPVAEVEEPINTADAGPVPPDAGPEPSASTEATPLKLDVINQWSNGFTANLTIQNPTGAATDGWSIVVEAPFEITNIWNAKIVESGSTSGGYRYTIESADWNGTIPAGGDLSIGFNGVGAPGELTAIAFNGEVLPSSPASGVDSSGSDDGGVDSGVDSGSMDSGQTPDNPSEDGSGASDSGNDPAPSEAPSEEDPAPAPADGDPAGEIPGDASDQGDIDNGAGAPIVEEPVVGNPASGDFNYGEALQKSLLFYEAQRSGPLPDDSRIEWRSDSALSDGADVGVDLTGGYYDAGDHVKFGLPMAGSMTLLTWGALEYKDAYQASGQMDELMDAVRWGTDYLLKAHITEGGKTKAFYGQVGDGNADHAYWGSAEDMTMARPAFAIDANNPGSDLAGESAAALAAASILFRESDPAYADLLLENAKQLYAFADEHRGKYSDSIDNAKNFYNSFSGYQDELAWGATWLYKATGDEAYLDKAEASYQGIGRYTHTWDDKAYGTAVLLAQESNNSRYSQDVEGWLNWWSDDGGGGIAYTDGGLAWLDQWGSTRLSANTAFLAGVYGDTVNDPNGRYTDFSDQQIDYILGDNPNNFSYMVGFGDRYAQQPHHRGAHGGGWDTFNSDAPNANILYGALVGGPASPDDNDYQDERSDYIRNEVALDYNAAFTGALARQYDQFGGDPLSDAELNALPGISVAE